MAHSPPPSTSPDSSHIALDQIDPSRHLIAIVQLPPGGGTNNDCTANLVNRGKFLRKFCKRLFKHPKSQLAKRLTGDQGRQQLELFKAAATSSGDLEQLLPFVGRLSDGGWGLRHLPTHRLLIRPSSSQPTSSADAEPEQLMTRADWSVDIDQETLGNKDPSSSIPAKHQIDTSVMATSQVSRQQSRGKRLPSPDLFATDSESFVGESSSSAKPSTAKRRRKFNC